MKLGIVVLGLGLLLGTAGGAGAVNCKQVNKYLETGRSVKDVAETMVVGESDVRACQEEAAEAKAAEKKGGAADGSAANATEKAE